LSEIQNLVPVFPAKDLQRSVQTWSAILGAAPTFVDGDRWAQFDVGGRRVALAGSDRTSDAAGLMIKVDDLPAAIKALSDRGVVVGPINEGPHELRCSIEIEDGWSVVLYAGKKPR
jgi:hypothetical protein